MSTTRWISGLIAVGLSIIVARSSARADDGAPADNQVDAAIARGVAFLKEAQARDGHWDDPGQLEHRLGVTALAGLALLENGIARDDLAIARADGRHGTRRNFRSDV